jgi:hypothetical protein
LAEDDAPGDVSPGIANQRAMMIASLQARVDWWVRCRPYVPISRGYPHVPVTADADLLSPKPGAGLFDDLADALAAAPLTMETQLVCEGPNHLADKLITASHQIPGELRLTAQSMEGASLLASALHAHAAKKCPKALEWPPTLPNPAPSGYVGRNAIVPARRPPPCPFSASSSSA